MRKQSTWTVVLLATLMGAGMAACERDSAQSGASNRDPAFDQNRVTQKGRIVL